MPSSRRDVVVRLLKSAASFHFNVTIVRASFYRQHKRTEARIVKLKTKGAAFTKPLSLTARYSFTYVHLYGCVYLRGRVFTGATRLCVNVFLMFLMRGVYAGNEEIKHCPWRLCCVIKRSRLEKSICWRIPKEETTVSKCAKECEREIRRGRRGLMTWATRARRHFEQKATSEISLHKTERSRYVPLQYNRDK